MKCTKMTGCGKHYAHLGPCGGFTFEDMRPLDDLVHRRIDLDGTPTPPVPRTPPEPTIPASDHQRLQAEAAAYRAALEETLISEIQDDPDDESARIRWCFDCDTGAENGVINHAPECLLSSSAGSALLAEMEEMRKERDAAASESAAMLDVLEQVHADALCDHPVVRDGTHDRVIAVLDRADAGDAFRARCEQAEIDRDAARAESATLRSRLETVERERDEALAANEGLLSKDDENVIHQMHREKLRRAVEEAVAKEREACAQLAQFFSDDRVRCADVAAAIRSRGGA